LCTGTLVHGNSSFTLLSEFKSMCAIAGILNIKADKPIDIPTLGRMVEVQRHRGPDETGMYVDDRIGLGHARLSIIDLSSGIQPIHNRDKTIWIVYNGEAFNYPELRKDLIRKGHSFYTETDTEVVLHLYEEEGISCLEKLNGQFAFAIWDLRKGQLFLARDRVGIHPLHYCLRKGQLLFASEIKGLFAHQDLEKAIDPEALDQIFTFWTTLPGKTFFKGVHEVPAGHYLLVKDGNVTLRKYWDHHFEPEAVGSDEEIVQKTLDLIQDAARIRLRADVPVGSYLSGGLDSSGLTALVRRHFTNHLHTFGIGFEEKTFDESRYQKELVEFLQVDHSALNATNAQICASFEKALWHCEKPLLRTAPVPLFLLSELVRKSGFKVVLTGEGADEVFGGYNIFREAKVRSFWAKEPASVSRPLLLRKLYPYIFGDNRLHGTAASFFGQGLTDLDDPFYSHRIRWKNTSRAKDFFSEEMRRGLRGYDCLEELRGVLPERFSEWDILSKAQYLETKLFMETYLLSSQGDRMAMANSVEVRPPYLDHRVVELAGRLPSHWKIRALKEKYILKKSFAKRLPDNIINRSKQPYRAPIRNTLMQYQDSRLKENLDQAALEKSGFFDAKKVAFLVKKMEKAPRVSETDEMAITGIFSTQIIAGQFTGSGRGEMSTPSPPDLFIDHRSKPSSEKRETR